MAIQSARTKIRKRATTKTRRPPRLPDAHAYAYAEPGEGRWLPPRDNTSPPPQFSARVARIVYRDPVYLEFNNVDGLAEGVRFQLVCASEGGDGSADFSRDDVIELSSDMRHGIDERRRRISFHFDQAKMDELGMKPGHRYFYRAVAADGTPSRQVGAVQLKANRFRPRAFHPDRFVAADDSVHGGHEAIRTLVGDSSYVATPMLFARDTTPPAVHTQNLEFYRLAPMRQEERKISVGVLRQQSWRCFLRVMGLPPTTEMLAIDELFAAAERMPRQEQRIIQRLKADPKVVTKLKTISQFFCGAPDGHISVDATPYVWTKGLYARGSGVAEPGIRLYIDDSPTGQRPRHHVGSIGAVVDDSGSIGTVKVSESYRGEVGVWAIDKSTHGIARQSERQTVDITTATVI